MIRKKYFMFTLLFLFIFIFAGCSSENVQEETIKDGVSENYKNNSVEIAEEYATQEVEVEDSFGMNDMDSVERDSTPKLKSSEITTINTSQFDYGNRKIIKRGNLRLETLDYKNSYDILKASTMDLGGYFEGVNEYVSDRNKKLKRANFTIRIPKENFEFFMETAGDIGYITEKQSNLEDISDNYFDTEARLDTLKIQEERLLILLRKTNNLEHILELESKLADTRYQIEKFTGTLKKYDSLINYSIINIQLVETEEQKIEEPTKKEGLFTRIKHNISKSFDSTKNTIEELILFLALNFITIIFWIIVLFIILFLFFKWKRKKLPHKNIQKKDTDTEKDKE